MKWITFALTLHCLLMASISNATSISVEKMLESWCGKDLLKLSPAKQAEFQKFFNTRLLSAKDKRSMFSPESLFLNNDTGYVWKFGASRTGSYLIYLSPHTGMVPSAEHAWLFIVNKEGKVQSRSDFDTGWRMYADGAEFTRVSWMSGPVLIQKMVDGMNGQGPRKIYLGFDGLRPAVVRIENEKGSSRRMDYYAPNWVVGPLFRGTKKTSMLGALKSASEVRRLEALVWLSGQFQVPKNVPDNSDRQFLKERAKHTKLIRDPDIAKVVKSLRMSSNKYTQELANAVRLL